MRHLPPICTKILHGHDAWVVGSAADPSAKLSDLRDIDIMVPFRNWAEAALLIPPDARPNTFGGWKFTDGPVTVDVWCGDLSHVMTSAIATKAWHPRTNSYLYKA